MLIKHVTLLSMQDVSGFLDKANRNLYNIVILPLANSLEKAHTAQEIHNIIVQLRSNLDNHGLKDMDSVMPRAEKVSSLKYS